MLVPRLSSQLTKFAALILAAFFAGGSLIGEPVIDLLVLTNQEVEDYHEGPDGMMAFFQTAIARANLGLENSQIDLRIRLQGVEKIDYESSRSDMSEDLEYITNSEEIAQLRDKWGADLVSFIRPGIADLTIGVAWILRDENGHPERGYNVVASNSVTHRSTLLHEIGHNLGAAHDRENAAAGGIHPYSHGHRFGASDGKNYRTVMAYQPGDPINHFSNPNISYLNEPTGIASGEFAADNARSLNRTGAIVANYRAHIHIPPQANAGPDRWIEDLDGDGVVSFQMDGSRSSYEDGVSSWVWTWATGSADGADPIIELPVGINEITLEITDLEGYQSSDTVSVDVLEQTPLAQIEAGESYSLFVKEHRAVWGAGHSNRGQLGFGNENRPNYLQLLNLANVRSVAASQGHTLIVKTDGSLWAMGYNSQGQLGIGDTEMQFNPVEVFENGVASVSAGHRHSLVLMEDGSVWAMGANSFGQLGNGNFDSSSVPIKIVESQVVSIEAGSNSSFIVMENGSAWACGRNAGSEAYEPVFRRIFESNVTSISAMRHALFLFEDGSVWAMGANERSQLGDGTNDYRYQPVIVLDSEVKSVSAGDSFSLFLMDNSSLRISGSDLFESTAIQRKWPSVSIASGVRSIAAGGYHFLVEREDLSIWGIGDNANGQLGPSGFTRSTELVQVFDPIGEWNNSAPIANAGLDIEIPDGDGDRTESILLDASSSVDDWQIVSWEWDWGYGKATGKSATGVFGEGTTDVRLMVMDDNGIEREDTIEVTIRRQSRIVSLACGYDHTLLLKRDGSLWGTGSNEWGQIGLGTLDESRAFRLIEGSDVKGVSSSLFHTLYWKEDGSLWGMGNDSDGELMRNGQPPARNPVKLVDDKVLWAAAGPRTTFFALSDGSVWAVGRNHKGQLGDGSTKSRNDPVKIFNDGILAIAPTEEFTAFLKADGSVWLAGSDRDQDESIDTTKPWLLVDSGVIQIRSSNKYVAMLKGDNTLHWYGVLDGSNPREYWSPRVEQIQQPFNEIVSAGRFAIYARNRIR